VTAIGSTPSWWSWTSRVGEPGALVTNAGSVGAGDPDRVLAGAMVEPGERLFAELEVGINAASSP